jgi:hypothetical protein
MEDVVGQSLLRVDTSWTKHHVLRLYTANTSVHSCKPLVPCGPWGIQNCETGSHGAPADVAPCAVLWDAALWR